MSAAPRAADGDDQRTRCRRDEDQRLSVLSNPPRRRHPARVGDEVFAASLALALILFRWVAVRPLALTIHCFFSKLPARHRRAQLISTGAVPRKWKGEREPPQHFKVLPYPDLPAGRGRGATSTAPPPSSRGVWGEGWKSRWKLLEHGGRAWWKWLLLPHVFTIRDRCFDLGPSVTTRILPASNSRSMASASATLFNFSDVASRSLAKQAGA